MGAKEPGGPRWPPTLAGQSGLPLKGPAEQQVTWPGWKASPASVQRGGYSESLASGLVVGVGGSQGCALCSGLLSSIRLSPIEHGVPSESRQGQPSPLHPWPLWNHHQSGGHGPSAPAEQAHFSVTSNCDRVRGLSRLL